MTLKVHFFACYTALHKNCINAGERLSRKKVNLFVTQKLPYAICTIWLWIRFIMLILYASVKQIPKKHDKAIWKWSLILTYIRIFKKNDWKYLALVENSRLKPAVYAQYNDTLQMDNIILCWSHLMGVKQFWGFVITQCKCQKCGDQRWSHIW